MRDKKFNFKKIKKKLKKKKEFLIIFFFIIKLCFI